MLAPTAEILALLHDASSGFHDIKPLPPFPAQSPLSWYLVLSAGAIVGLLVHRLYKRRLASKPETPLLTAKQQLDAEFSSLEADLKSGKPMGLADGGETISALLRNYLDRLCSIRARELTSSEIRRVLPGAICKVAGSSPAEATELTSEFDNVLHTCEGLEFAGISSSAGNASPLLELLSKAKAVAAKLEELKAKHDRTVLAPTTKEGGR